MNQSLAFRINATVSALFLFGIILSITAIVVFRITISTSEDLSSIVIPVTNATSEASDKFKDARYDLRVYLLKNDPERLTSAKTIFNELIKTVDGIDSYLVKKDSPEFVQYREDNQKVKALIDTYGKSLDDAKVQIDGIIAAFNKVDDDYKAFVAEVDGFQKLLMNILNTATNKGTPEYAALVGRIQEVINDSFNMSVESTSLVGSARTARQSLMVSYLDGWETKIKDINANLQDISATLTREDTKRYLNNMMKHSNSFLVSVNTFVDQINKTTAADEQRMLVSVQLADAITTISNETNELARSDTENLVNLTNKAVTAIIIIIIMFVVLGVFVLVFINKQVIAKLIRFLGLVEGFTSGDGDLTKRIPVTSKDEIGELARSINIFVENVHGIITEVKLAADDVASGNNELAATMEELSTTFSMQSEQISSVAENMNTMSTSATGMVRSLSSNMDKMREANGSISEGNSQLKELVVQMNDIKDRTNQLSITINSLSESSGKIGEILGVINDIADQTNLLALNAAIEAARAGDAGRGFAVVADEVRKLAERTQKSTSEIAQIITSLQNGSAAASKEMTSANESVGHGLNSIKSTDSKFEEVVGSVSDISNTTNEVNNGINDQFTMIQSINDNTQGLASGIEESVQVVSEVTVTVNHLQQRADTLKQIVAKFKV
jgi:methyl-accepting chemotaxis protein